MSPSSAFDFLNKGGWVAWVLAVASVILWYALGYRFLFLQSKSLRKNPESLLQNDWQDDDILSQTLRNIKDRVHGSTKDLETSLQVEWHHFCQQVSCHRSTIKAIVIVAPLLGLLGTVIGMIETFDSLKDAALFTQGGGIAGGISQALITTQMGLVVAIPGLLIGKKLDQKEKAHTDFVERSISRILLKETTHEA